MAFIYSNEGDYLTALDLNFKSLKIQEELDNKPGISKNLLLIGVIFANQNDFKKALDYYFRALNIQRTINDPVRLSSVLADICDAYTNLADYDKALQYSQEALKAAEVSGDEGLIGGMYANIGIIYLNKSDFKQAETYLLKGLWLVNKANYMLSKGEILYNIGELYLKTKRYSEAKKYYLQGLVYTDSVNDKPGIGSLYESLSEVFEHEGDLANALKYYKKSVVVNDTIFNDKKSKEITRKELTYSFQKKQDSLKLVQEKKDMLVKQEITHQKTIRNSIIASGGGIVLIGFLGFINFRNKRKREKAELSQQVSETEMKSLRTQMNPHFIFNALQSIQLFLLNNKTEETNTYLLKFSKLMRLVLENSQHAEVAIHKDFEALELYIQLENLRMQFPFSYNLNIDQNIDEENATILPLILQPFVENAIWHGLQYKPRPGHIDIRITRQLELMLCTVKDDGVGRVFAQQMKTLNGENNKSLGLKITAERLALLNQLKNTTASFKITDLFDENNKPSGTLVTLNLPYYGNH